MNEKCAEIVYIVHMREKDLNIDVRATGKKITELLREKNKEVKDLQVYLKLEGPQPIYRWMKGKTLPSVYNLYAIARFFDVKIDDLIISRTMKNLLIESNEKDECFYVGRVQEYGERLTLRS